MKTETFDEREKRILTLWKEKRIFERSIEERKNQPLFSFYDGPPFATGLPHYGHLLAGTIKDVIPRYKTMKGFCVPRRFGWDCHGLPIEQEVEKGQKLSGAHAIEAFGIAQFNEKCREIVLRYTEEWKAIVGRMGRWVDFSQTYKTMDRPFMESVWWVFKQLYDKGLVYEGFKVMPFSAKLGTPLSNFEAGENYQEVDDPSLTVAFTLENDPNTALLIWTTTPWTLVSNLAVMVGPTIDYLKVKEKKSGKNYIFAEARLAELFPGEEAAQLEIIERMKGEALVGLRYIPLFDYFADHKAEGAFRVIPEDSVSVEEGTGIVHSAPAFGEVDFYACQAAGISLVCPVDNNGQFTDKIPEYRGIFVKDADKDIIKRLKAQDKVFRHATCRHRYPFCWRSDTPLIYKAVNTWFVAVEKIKEALIAANHEIHWTPEHIKYGRFGKWLEGARDWAISRNRYWGTPIPLWRSDDGDIIAIGNIEELEKLTGKSLPDIHRHFIDDLTFVKEGKTYRRISEVFDCWFESGSMPYAQNHYPFENKETFEKSFPADFIAEGLDQTRGWFYTLTVLSAALFQKPAFKNVIVNGIILAENGAKMSKRLQNYPDPMEVVHRHGADAVRLYMMHSPAVKAEDLCFTEKGVELVLRVILIPWWNAYSFFSTYAKLYGWTPSETFSPPDQVIDKWILSKLHQLIHQVELGMDDYDLSAAVEPFIAFIDQLTNWYIRRCRRRFWADEESLDRRQAFETLYTVLLELSKIAAPFTPFLSDAIYQELKTPSMPDSVHLCPFPRYCPQVRDEALEKAMEAVQQTVSLGHALRKEKKLKVRQPLRKALLASPDPQTLQFLREQSHLIAEELNVKEVECVADDSQFVRLTSKPNFQTLGKKLGRLLRSAQGIIQSFTKEQLESLLRGEVLVVEIEGVNVELTREDVLIDRIVNEGIVAANAGLITIALDTALDEALRREGIAREIVNKINTMRRDGGFNVSDRIRVKMETSDFVKLCYEEWQSYIDHEVLAVAVDFGSVPEGTLWDLNDEPARIMIERNLT